MGVLNTAHDFFVVRLYMPVSGVLYSDLERGSGAFCLEESGVFKQRMDKYFGVSKTCVSFNGS